MMTCLSGTLTRKERNRTGSQSLNITALMSTLQISLSGLYCPRLKAGGVSPFTHGRVHLDVKQVIIQLDDSLLV